MGSPDSIAHSHTMADDELEQELLMVAGRNRSGGGKQPRAPPAKKKGGKKRGGAEDEDYEEDDGSEDLFGSDDEEEEEEDEEEDEEEEEEEEVEERPKPKRKAAAGSSGGGGKRARREEEEEEQEDDDEDDDLDDDDVENLYFDEADKRRLQAMTELDREMILSERAEERDKQRQRRALIKSAKEAAAAEKVRRQCCIWAWGGEATMFSLIRSASTCAACPHAPMHAHNSNAHFIPHPVSGFLASHTSMPFPLLQGPRRSRSLRQRPGADDRADKDSAIRQIRAARARQEGKKKKGERGRAQLI